MEINDNHSQFLNQLIMSIISIAFHQIIRINLLKNEIMLFFKRHIPRPMLYLSAFGVHFIRINLIYIYFA